MKIVEDRKNEIRNMGKNAGRFKTTMKYVYESSKGRLGFKSELSPKLSVTNVRTNH